MTALEKKKIEAEFMAVKSARVQLEYKILECEDQIERLRAHIGIQLQKEAELEAKLAPTAIGG